MSYYLSCTEDDAEVKKAIDEVQGVYDAHGKWEWVEWAGKTLMPRLHVQIAIERANEMRVEQEALEEMQRQDERHSKSGRGQKRRWSWRRRRPSTFGN
jgi:hypothetical protein